MAEEEKKEPRLVSRRAFLRGSGVVLSGAVVVGSVGLGSGTVEAATTEPSPGQLPVQPAPVQQAAATTPARAATMPAVAYLVVDPKKCAGCTSCMMACSMVHEKKASLSTSRIQITQTATAAFPFDLEISQCRQCTDPLCVDNCPTGACHVDTSNGNLRVIDQSKCIGCQTCLRMCPHPAHRAVWNAETRKATKCDLCSDAPYLGAEGGPGGKQACVSACPMDALSVVMVVPDQTDDLGYRVNLRKD